MTSSHHAKLNGFAKSFTKEEGNDVPAEKTTKRLLPEISHEAKSLIPSV